MNTPASIAGHPIHPMLVTVPIGLWIFSLACDLWLHLLGGPQWLAIAAFATMAGGVIGAFAAMVPGLMDGLSLRDAPRRIALIHMALNIAVVVLYLVNLRLRAAGTDSLAPLSLSLIAAGVLGVSGWLGGKMVYIHQVGVDETRGRGQVPAPERS